MFNPNPAFRLCAKVEIGPKGFTLGVKAEIEKKPFNLPQVLMNADFMAMYWPQGWKKDTIKFGRPICNLWGANVPAFIY